MNNKKNVKLFLGVILSITFTACGSGGSNSTNNTTDVATTSSNSDSNISVAQEEPIVEQNITIEDNITEPIVEANITQEDNITQEINTTEIINLITTRPLKTGQVKSYDTLGHEVLDGSLKDDGFYQKGADLLYSRDNENEIVTNASTGLQWQDDEAVTSIKKIWLNESMANMCNSGSLPNTCYETSGDTAYTYCNELSLSGFEDWRLPTRFELANIINYGRISPSINAVFQNRNSAKYWSSTTYTNSHGYAWEVNFYKGDVNIKGKGGNDLYIRCVRDDNSSQVSHSFSRDNAKNIVTDNKTGLRWQDGISVVQYTRTWEEGIDYCENLSLDGEDWRLPNINELKTIIDDNRSNPSIYHAFKKTDTATNEMFYWSSTTYAGLEKDAWGVSFKSGSIVNYTKNNFFFVRCVKDIE